jgi:hypothetical protein
MSIGLQDAVKIDKGMIGRKGAVTGDKIQAFLDAGFPAELPANPGPFTYHQVSTNITLYMGSVIQGPGQGLCTLEWVGAAAQSILEYSAGVFTPSHITLEGFTLRATTANNVTGIRLINGGFETLKDIGFQGISCHYFIQGGFRPAIYNTYAAGAGSNDVGGAYFDTVPHVIISGYTTYGQSLGMGDGTITRNGVITFNRVAVVTAQSINVYGSSDRTGTIYGVIIEGDNQGAYFTDCVVVGGYSGLTARLAASGSPTFVGLTNFNVDQATHYAMELSQVAALRILGCDITNSWRGIVMGAWNLVNTSEISHCYFENLRHESIWCAGPPGSLHIWNNRFGDGALSGALPADAPLTPLFSLEDGAGPLAATNDAAILFSGGAAPPNITDTCIKVENNDGRDRGLVKPFIVDQTTSALERYFNFNSGTAPIITDLTNTTVNHRTQLQTDSHVKIKKTAIGSPPTNPQTGYGNFWIGDDNRAYVNTGTDNRPLIDADVFTAAGMLLVGTADEAWSSLAIGAARQGLIVNAAGNALQWAASMHSLLTTQGMIPYASAANTPAALAIGANKTILASNGTIPGWTATPVISGLLIDETDIRSPKFSDFTNTAMNYRIFKTVTPIANNAVAAILPFTGNGAGTDVIIMVTSNVRQTAMFQCTGSANITIELLDPGNNYSTVAGTAASNNIYWSAANSRYEIENKSGSARDYIVFIMTAS